MQESHKTIVLDGIVVVNMTDLAVHANCSFHEGLLTRKSLPNVLVGVHKFERKLLVCYVSYDRFISS